MIEDKLSLLTAAIEANTTALNAVLAAGGAPTNVTPMPEAPKKAGRPPKAAPAPETEPVVEEKPTKVAAPEPAAEEFSDPLDPETKVVVKGDPAPPKIDTDAVIADCVESFKAHMVAAAEDAERKAFLKEQFEALRNKYGLAPGAKLITLAPTPEKLTGLLADIKAL